MKWHRDNPEYKPPHAVKAGGKQHFFEWLDDNFWSFSTRFGYLVPEELALTLLRDCIFWALGPSSLDLPIIQSEQSSNIHRKTQQLPLGSCQVSR